MNVGLGIKKIRREKNISQGSLAILVGISQTSLYQIEKGKKQPSQKTFQTICNKLEVAEIVVYMAALEKVDVPEKNKELYSLLYPTVEEMIKRIVT